MEDSRIVDLYWIRSESAIDETETKYGKYCYAIANNILANTEDAQESVNDTYLGAWNSMPPHRPAILSSFLGKITRRISIKKWQEKHACKRGGGEIVLVLDELADCIPSEQSVDKEM
jgi:RNA polymerase sigma-70 factor (ECF subfamily)